MIRLKNSAQIAAMKDAGRITGEALLIARDMVRPGVSTYEIDQAIRHYIEKCGATPTFVGYGGFPASACISINDEVIHGIPSKQRILREGDIVKIDTGATYRGYVGDSARTIPVGNVSEEAKKLIRKTRFQKYFRLALHGWMEYHIAAMETSTNSFLSNPAGKGAKKTLEQNLGSRGKSKGE